MRSKGAEKTKRSSGDCVKPRKGYYRLLETG